MQRREHDHAAPGEQDPEERLHERSARADEDRDPLTLERPAPCLTEEHGRHAKRARDDVAVRMTTPAIKNGHA